MWGSLMLYPAKITDTHDLDRGTDCKIASIKFVAGILLVAEDDWDRLISVEIDAAMELVESDRVGRLVHPAIKEIAVFNALNEFLQRIRESRVGTFDYQVEVR